jgi:hypothetical protein
MTAAIGTIILIFITKKIKLSCVAAPITIEVIAMLYYVITVGSISQFGPLPYLIAFPFLLLGSLAGSIFWVLVFGKKVPPKGQ